MDKRFIRIHQNDNVAVALEDVPAGSHVTVDGKEYTVDGDIPLDVYKRQSLFLIRRWGYGLIGLNFKLFQKLLLF